MTIKADITCKQIDTIQYSDNIHSQTAFKVGTMPLYVPLESFIETLYQSGSLNLQSAITECKKEKRKIHCTTFNTIRLE